MMGGVRRWYDTVNTQFAAVDTKFGNYLLLTGGTLSGNLHAPYLHSTGNIDAGGQIAGASISSSGSIAAAGGITSTGNISSSGTVIGAAISSTGNIAATGGITGASMYSYGAITAAGGMSAAGMTVGVGGLVVHAATQVDGTLNAGGVTAGSASFATTITAGTNISANGAIQAAGQITGNFLVSTGHAQVAGTVIVGGATLASSSGDLTAIYDRSGNANITMYNSANINYYQSGTHQFTARGSATTGATYAVFNAGGTYNQTGGWGTISDDRLKTEVEPYRGDFLQAVLALDPVSFRYARGPFKGDQRLYGLMASNVKRVLPEMVSTSTFVDEGGKELTVDTLLPTHLVYVLIGAAKELACRLDAIETKLEGK